MTLIHLGCNTVRKSLSLIVIEDSFHQITHSEMTQSFLKDKTVRKGSPKRKLGANIVQVLDDLKESESGGLEGYGENHNLTHKSCLWELPYAKALILPNNIDLMHQERNIVKSIMNMCLDVTGFMKDNMNARKDLATLCNRLSLETKPNARGN
jgi:hypothetical protein